MNIFYVSSDLAVKKVHEEEQSFIVATVNAIAGDWSERHSRLYWS